jgi:steroid 5-alpha reductase family enzyme
MTTTFDLLLTLSISLLIQAVMFVFAASFKTDKVTDLSYGLSFITLAVVLLVLNDSTQPASRVLAAMVIVWGIRLAAYLLYRIVRIKRDPRFDGVRDRFWKFLQFWAFQGFIVWVIMLPVTLWFGNAGPWNGLMSVAVLVWATGLIIETVADAQKFAEKSRASGRSRWMASGLWRYSRHPNYFGELLCWWGIFLFVSGDLFGWSWMGILGPISLTYILIYVTGIPTLERSADRKWGDDVEYREYKERTSVLIPWFSSRRPMGDGFTSDP